MKPRRLDDGFDEGDAGCVLNSWRLGTALILGGVGSMAASNWALFALLPEEHFKTLGPTESLVVLVSLILQIMSLLQQATRPSLGATLWASRIVFTVKTMAALTNYLLYTWPTPFIVDSMTGRPNCMVRFAEWTTMSFLMAFVIDGSDATELRGPLLLALCQSASAGLGAALAFVSAPWLWGTVLAISVVLFSTLFARLYERTHRLRELERVLLPDAYPVLRVKLALRLNRQCCFFWSLMVSGWFVDVYARAYLQYASSPDWCFIADCVIDVAAKLFYADIVQNDSQTFPVIFRAMRGREAAERMEFVWNDATDVIIVSRRLKNGSFSTAASPSLAQLVGQREAAPWINCSCHGHGSADFERLLSEGAKPRLPTRDDSLPMEELVSVAWWHSRFSCLLARSDGVARVCDVSASVSEDAAGCVMILRDETDRQRLIEMERKALSATIERRKDEEANRFTRHEVKNGVLSAISQLDTLHSEVGSGNASPNFVHMLGSMRRGLSQTLETVLSQAMARDVMHGNYVPRTSPCLVVEAFEGEALAEVDGSRKARFPIKTMPAEGFPKIDVDRRLLALIYRNAISNACKYGKRDGVVSTEVELSDGTLTVRVENEPGAGHEQLLQMQEEAGEAGFVFEKGVQLHTSVRHTTGLTSSRVSKGDGGWIMMRCAECMRGSCSIRFHPDRTVFEMTCPAPEPEPFNEAFLDSADLSTNVWAVGVEDSPQQRRVLRLIFRRLGIPTERVTIMGEDDEQIQGMGDFVVQLLQRIPPDAAVLLVVDENLELEGPSEETISGSLSVQCMRQGLKPADEARLLSLVRSANDSERDLGHYLERAHGFLNKAPSEPDRTAILRKWAKHFGMKRVTVPKSPLAEESK